MKSKHRSAIITEFKAGEEMGIPKEWKGASNYVCLKKLENVNKKRELDDKPQT